MQEVEIFTDGSCLPGGAGGYAALLAHESNQKLISGGSLNATAPRMELMALVEALKCLTEPVVATVFTDSTYIIQVYAKWTKEDLQTSPKQPPNADLIQELVTLSKPHQLTFQWVRAHTGFPGNEIVDRAARKAASQVVPKPVSKFVRA